MPRPSVLDQLDDPRSELVLSVGAHTLSVTNLDKVLWPAPKGQRRRGGAALTKRDLLRYFARVSSWLLPHLRDRPLFVTRFPSGIAGKSFYQKVWENPPPFVRTTSIWSSDNDADRDYVLCDNLATLLWLGQLASLELHVWFSRTNPRPDGRGLGRRFGGSEAVLDRSLLNYPDFVVFDLDPYLYSGREGSGAEPELHRRAFNRTRNLALHIRDLLDALGIATYVKTSGRTGLHLYAPILRRFTYDEVRAMAEVVGRFVASGRPRDVTLEWSVKRRTGKIFFDYNQNARGRSLSAAYSPRRHAEGSVSMPLAWDDLPRIYPTDFTLRTVPDLLEQHGDPWASMLEDKQDLGALLDSRGPLARAG